MGEKYMHQPLTKGDKLSVALYRAGIVFSTISISTGACMLFNQASYSNEPLVMLKANLALIALYISVGMSVFFIHLYVGKFHRLLKKLYYAAVAVLLISFVFWKQAIPYILINKPYGPMLLLPLSLCLGFITAKEAFCFKLMEGYLLAVIMPLYLVLLSTGSMPADFAFYGLSFISLLLVFFTIRKVFMPLHYDIGDKSAYIY